MIRLILIIVITLFYFPTSTDASVSDNIIKALERIDAEYSALPKNPKNADKLFALDNELRIIVAEANKKYPRDEIDSVLDLENENLGLHLNSALYYSGKLMDEGDKLLPPYVPVAQRKKSAPLVRGEKFTPFKDALERIYSEYSALAIKPEDTDTLYRLHKEVSSVVEQIVKYYPYQASQKFWDTKYRKIGIDIGHYSDQLEYSGKLILDLHKANPNSRYREESLWASMYGEFRSGNNEISTPDIKLIYAYLKEFPNSIYASTAYGNLASFYHGLYRFMRYNKNDTREKECYESYLSKSPIKEQLLQAQNKGIENYKKAIEKSKIAGEQQMYENKFYELRNGTDSEYDTWCAISD